METPCIRRDQSFHIHLHGVGGALFTVACMAYIALAMTPFLRLPGSCQYLPGMEWTILRKLPCIFLGGAGTLIVAIALLRGGFFGFAMKQMLIVQYALFGTLFLLAMLVLGVGLCCVIVWIMKGPAYIMDAYYLPDHETEHVR